MEQLFGQDALSQVMSGRGVDQLHTLDLRQRPGEVLDPDDAPARLDESAGHVRHDSCFPRGPGIVPVWIHHPGAEPRLDGR